MLTLHHLNNSRSQKILWLLEELELPYELVSYQRDPQTLMGPPALKALHPLGKSPVVTDGKLVLAESGAIIETLVETHGEGRFSPEPGTADHRRYRYFMHYAEGSLMPPLLLKLVFDEVEAKAPLLVRPIAKAISATVKARFITPNLTQHLDFLEHFAGAFRHGAEGVLGDMDRQARFLTEKAVEAPQQGARPDSGELEKLRRIDRPGGDDDFAARACR